MAMRWIIAEFLALKPSTFFELLENTVLIGNFNGP